MDSKIKNVVFDLGGVLINLDFDNCLNAFRKSRISRYRETGMPVQGKKVSFPNLNWVKSARKNSGKPFVRRSAKPCPTMKLMICGT